MDQRDVNGVIEQLAIATRATLELERLKTEDTDDLIAELRHALAEAWAKLLYRE